MPFYMPASTNGWRLGVIRMSAQVKPGKHTHTHTLHEIIDSSPKFLQDDKFERRGQRRWNLGRTG